MAQPVSLIRFFVKKAGIVLCALVLLFMTACNDNVTESTGSSFSSSTASGSGGGASTTAGDPISSESRATLGTTRTGAKTNSTVTKNNSTYSKTGKSTTKSSGPSLKLYPIPSDLMDNVIGSMHSVSVNGKSCFVYKSEVTAGADYKSGFAEYASFDFSGSATVKVTANYAVGSVEILPSRDNITYKSSGNVITFTIKKEGQYFVKINGDSSNGNTAANPLYIFANPPEENVPDKNDPNVVYFEPGVYYHKVYYLESGKTYYLAPGAFVYGRFYGVGLKNVTIRGRGTICGEELSSLGDDGRTICIKNSENITIEGIHVVHPKVWTVAIYQSKKIHIDNIKTISHGMSSDGCDIVACQNALVENSFFRGHDDMLAVKASTMSDYTTKVDCRDVTFRNCVVWCDSSNPMTIGYETVGDISNITFENIDVLNQSKPPVWRMEAIMAIEPHYTGTVDGVLYKNIRIDIKLDNAPQSLFRFAIDDGTGTIKNVRVEDVYVNYGGAMAGTIAGRGHAPNVSNFTFVNVRNSAGVKLKMENITRNIFVSTVNIQ